MVLAPDLAFTPDVQPRARGDVRLAVKPRAGRTVLDRIGQAGSLKCLFPRLPSQAFEAVLVNTAGGITGGDRFEISAHAAPQTELTLTTQACERAYKAQPGAVGRIRAHLSVAAHASVNWLPQETLLFDGCALDRKLTIDLAQTARLLMVEPLVFGRHAMGESLRIADVLDRIEINRDGVPIYLDAQRLVARASNHLLRPAIAKGAGAMASVVYVAPDAEAHLRPVRDMLPISAAASLKAEELLVIRCLARDSFELRRTLLPVLAHLSGAPLPRPWNL